jgi:hypothetical protein
MSITWDQVRGWRVSRQHLHRRAPRAALLDVVREVCGIHAQIQSSAELQIWARVNGVSPAEVRAALWEQRTLVRTWSMRGTLHVFTAEDLPLYVAALRTHDRWWKGAWLRVLGMGEHEVRDTLAAIRESLGARPITREQLARKVAARVGPKGSARMLSGWGEMLKPAAYDGSLISGPPQGQSVTFVRPDRWLGKWKEPPSEDAWHEIVRRYLHAYGPATREDFGRWWGMQPAPAGRILQASSENLAEVDVDGRTAWAPRHDLKAMRKAAPANSVRLLPAFDVYVTGNRPKESFVEKRFENRVFRQAGWISPVVLVGGVIRGVWQHARANRRINVAVQPFRRLASAEKNAIAEEADRLGRFLGAPSSVSYEKV